MKKLSIILFLCLNICNYIFAGPACPKPFNVVQPNGDTISITLNGDEYLSCYKDSKGYIIDKNDEGYWVYVNVKKGKRFLTNQIVTQTSIPQKINNKAISEYMSQICEKNYQRRHEKLRDFVIKNEKVKNWINPNIECCETKDPINDLSWLVSKTNFGKYDFSCLLLYKNDSTNEYYIVNHYIDFEFRRAFESNNATNFIIIYKCDGQRINGGHFLDRNSDFYEHLIFAPNKNLEKSITKVNKIFHKKYTQTDKLIKIAEQKKLRYMCGIIMDSCDNCDSFLNSHTLVDIIGYSFIKYPINVKQQIK